MYVNILKKGNPMLKLDKIIDKLLSKTPIFSSQSGEIYLTQHGSILKNNFAEFFLLTDSEREEFIQNNIPIKNPDKNERILG